MISTQELNEEWQKINSNGHSKNYLAGFKDCKNFTIRLQNSPVKNEEISHYADTASDVLTDISLATTDSINSPRPIGQNLTEHQIKQKLQEVYCYLYKLECELLIPQGEQSCHCQEQPT